MPDTTTKQNYQDRTKELTDRLEQGMKELFRSDKYKDYLNSMSHFHNYSSRNIMLINMQMPGATKVASFKLWSEKFNRQVKKGEKSIRIFAPVGNTTPEKVMMEKLDPETKAPLLDENGKVIMEEMTYLTNEPKFKLVPVFDVSQTHGAPLPELVENLTGNVEQYESFLEALKAISPLPIVFEPMNENKDGYCRYGEKIGIREGMSQVQTIAAIVHEITHARLHDKSIDGNDTKKPSFVKEVEAESVAYVVCQHHGIETAPNSFGYLAEWGNRDMTEIKASLDIIRKESAGLINAIDDHFKNICNEKGIDLTTKEPYVTITKPDVPMEPEYTVEASTENIAGVDFTIETIIPKEEVAKEAPTIELNNSLPDPAIGTAERDLYGYTYEGMLPLTKEVALELFDQDHPIYLLYDDNTEAMAFNREEIENFNGIFGIEADEWERFSEYKAVTAVNSEMAKESELIHGKGDTYGIYQLKSGDDTRYHRFSALQELENSQLAVDRANYELVYTAPFAEKETLETLYQKFNTDHPKDFTGHSLSVGDIVVIQKDGDVSSHYVDSFGFVELPAFLGEEKQIAESIPVVENNVIDEKSIIEPLEAKPIEKSVYHETLAFAREHGEMDQYKESNSLNTECIDAIHRAINEARYDTNHYRMNDAAKDVIAQYGAERVELVMAKIIQSADWDGRYSRQNKDWAKNFIIPHGMQDVYSNTHPCLLDGFLNKVREKPSILEAIKQNSNTVKSQDAPKKETPQKNNGLEM